jgi:FeS assembly SUF system protein
MNEAVGKIMDNVLSSGDAKPENEPNTPVAADANATGELSGAQNEVLKAKIVEALCTIYDPEIPVNIYELGLIYGLYVKDDGKVQVDMTLTSPACPVAGTLPIEVENKIAAVPGVTDVNLDLVWDPPYSMDMMSEAARLQLGLW